MKKYKVMIGIVIIAAAVAAVALFFKGRDKNAEIVNDVDEVMSYVSDEIEKVVNWSSSLDVAHLILPENNSELREEEDELTHVVLHFISNVVSDPYNPYDIDDVFSILKDYELSSHYVIDRDGSIYLFTPEDRVAYHAGRGSLINYPDYENKLNKHSIGIEILAMGTEQEMSTMISSNQYNLVDKSLIGYTDDQYEAVKMLLDDISSRHEGIELDKEHIVGHDDYSPEKTDPGSLFDWSRIGLN